MLGCLTLLQITMGVWFVELDWLDQDGKESKYVVVHSCNHVNYGSRYWSLLPDFVRPLDASCLGQKPCLPFFEWHLFWNFLKDTSCYICILTPIFWLHLHLTPMSTPILAASTFWDQCPLQFLVETHTSLLCQKQNFIHCLTFWGLPLLPVPLHITDRRGKYQVLCKPTWHHIGIGIIFPYLHLRMIPPKQNFIDCLTFWGLPLLPVSTPHHW